MNEEELFELAKKFGDNYTYGKIVKVLKEKFIDKEKVKEVISYLGTGREFEMGEDKANAINYEVCKCLNHLKKELGLVDNRIKLESSNLDYAAYSEKEQELTIWFKNRKSETRYVYSKVPVTVFGELMKSESKGKFFQSSIRNIYAVEKID